MNVCIYGKCLQKPPNKGPFSISYAISISLGVTFYITVGFCPRLFPKLNINKVWKFMQGLSELIESCHV